MGAYKDILIEMQEAHEAIRSGLMAAAGKAVAPKYIGSLIDYNDPLVREFYNVCSHGAFLELCLGIKTLGHTQQTDYSYEECNVLNHLVCYAPEAWKDEARDAFEKRYGVTITDYLPKPKKPEPVLHYEI